MYSNVLQRHKIMSSPSALLKRRQCSDRRDSWLSLHHPHIFQSASESSREDGRTHRQNKTIFYSHLTGFDVGRKCDSWAKLALKPQDEGCIVI